MATTSESNTIAQPASLIVSDSPDAAASNLEPFPTSRLDMERGYALSPMYSLILEYNKEQGSNLSTTAEVSWILQKPGLKLHDIEMREDNPDPHTAVRLVDSELQPIL